MLESGDLQTLDGYPSSMSDARRWRSIRTPGPPIIARDGMITQNGQQVGAIGLFSIDPATKLERFENSR